MTTRLKSFELQGYKTFASKTIFEFPQPITAIVGPNGSGKSNIADALRWVLGEQSYSLLRGKRTEDMIFSGSEQRHRAGMASATIVFDNHDHWLPIDYEEVSISRRAYRDGSNEYLINGQKVRLKDVSDLLGKSGLSQRTYTIIGQGLVDAALALKAEERRKLFEEAAGVEMYRTRRDEALRRLEQTQKNLQRVEDILSELKPRLQSLERQAQRAREYKIVKDELHSILSEWYGYHWHKSQKELARSIEFARTQEKYLKEARQRQMHIESQILQKKELIHSLRFKLNEWQRELTNLHNQEEAISRYLAVADERRRFLSQQEQEIEAIISAIKSDIEALSARIINENAAIDSKMEELNGVIARREGLTASLQEINKQQTSLLESLENRRNANLDLIKLLTENRAREHELRMNKIETQARLEGLRSQIKSLENQRHKALSNISQKENELEKLNTVILDLSTKIEQTKAQLEKLQSKRELINSTLSSENTKLAKLTAQFEVLEKAEINLVGFETGTRLLVKVSRKSNLVKLRGVLGLSIEVPEEYQKAIAAALGENLEAILLADQSSLEEALAFIEGQPAKSVLVPLSEIFPANNIGAPEYSGEILTCAAEVVSAPKEIETVIQLLLGSTFIVKDRIVAQNVIKRLRNSSEFRNRPDLRIVTLHGEVFSMQGLVRTDGGSGEGLFIKKREKQLIESQISRAQKTIFQLEQDQTQLENEIHRLQNQIETLSVELDLAEKEDANFQELIRGENFKLSTIQHQLEWKQTLIESSMEELSLTEITLTEIDQNIQDLSHQLENVQNEIDILEGKINNLTVSVIQDDLAEIRTKEALLEQSVEAHVHQRMEYEDQIKEREKQLEERAVEKGRIIQSLDEVIREIEAQRTQGYECAVRLSALIELIKPAEEELKENEAALQNLEVEEIAARKSLSHFEQAYARARIALTRQEELLNNLRRRIEDDFGLVAFDYASEVSGPTPLPLEGLVEKLPQIDTLAATIEESLRRQKALLRRIGAVNPEAEREYEEVHTRYEFMQSQVDDLKLAELDVRRVIDELDEIMKRDFQATFEAVADEFHRIFNRLFGGGTARLVLTDPDDITNTGIDIEAKLPGRREQGLSLLSGGERSLTAVALVFALLRVSPTPFCVLDEVDAMLDEANVSRFGELLRELSQTTQFLIITHNRATVQLADVIYGVTMGRDSTSQTLSLKMDEITQVI